MRKERERYCIDGNKIRRGREGLILKNRVEEAAWPTGVQTLRRKSIFMTIDNVRMQFGVCLSSKNRIECFATVIKS